MAKTAVVEENGKAGAISEPRGGAATESMIEFSRPYLVNVVLRGVSTMLFHAWSNEDVAGKQEAAKGSKQKKTDNVESYVYRNDEGIICVPGEYVRQAIINAAKYRQDPRSPRKSAMDLYKAGVVAMTELAPIVNAAGEPAATWDLIDMRRVTVQRAGITRSRPAFHSGWKCEMQLQVLLPEYIRLPDLQAVITDAGRLVGLADNRPTYGRFYIESFNLIEEL